MNSKSIKILSFILIACSNLILRRAMASFEDMASDLTAAMSTLRSRKETLKREIEADEQEWDKI